MNRVVALAPKISQESVRKLWTGRVVLQERVDLAKLKQNQERFQIEDGKPIHLKGGFGDTLLFGTTVALCAIGLAYMGKMYYSLAMPPKN